MNVWWRVCRSTGRVRTGTAVVAGAQQLFGAALMLVRRLSSQAFSRVFPLRRSGEVTAKTNTRKVTKCRRLKYNKIVHGLYYH